MGKSEKEKLRTLLQEALDSLRDRPVPPLGQDFTQQVMNRLSPPSLWRRFLTPSRRPLQWALGTVATAGLVLGLYFGPRWNRGERVIETSSLPPSHQITDRKMYQVRFSIKRPEAAEVKILGDFTQWNAMVLSKDGSGNFTGELTLPEGTYAYGFMVDGKEWVADQTAHGFVPDGFGRVNSIIHL
jgi:hypothetical protein